MSEDEFGTLIDVSVREAFAHEAHNFTPWLAENLDRLGSAIGVELELTETEASVGDFSADIFATRATDGAVVLIENQLEKSDHTHLGQIMTYLAGRDTRVIVWVATDFTDPHLSAIRWLNDNTPEDFAFFAVKLRVVRIENSPLAPLFEVIEEPNNWERQQRAKASANASPRTIARQEFWAHYMERHHGGEDHERVLRDAVRRTHLNGIDLIVRQYIAKNSVGVYVRAFDNSPVEEAEHILAPKMSSLEDRLGLPAGPTSGGWFFTTTRKGDYTNEAERNALSDWLHETVQRYVTVLEEELGNKQ